MYLSTTITQILMIRKQTNDTLLQFKWTKCHLYSLLNMNIK